MRAEETTIQAIQGSARLPPIVPCSESILSSKLRAHGIGGISWIEASAKDGGMGREVAIRINEGLMMLSGETQRGPRTMTLSIARCIFSAQLGMPPVLAPLIPRMKMEGYSTSNQLEHRASQPLSLWGNLCVYSPIYVAFLFIRIFPMRSIRQGQACLPRRPPHSAGALGFEDDLPHTQSTASQRTSSQRHRAFVERDLRLR